jgi:hypothetical protein
MNLSLGARLGVRALKISALQPNSATKSGPLTQSRCPLPLDIPPKYTKVLKPAPSPVLPPVSSTDLPRLCLHPVAASYATDKDSTPTSAQKDPRQKSAKSKVDVEADRHRARREMDPPPSDDKPSPPKKAKYAKGPVPTTPPTTSHPRHGRIRERLCNLPPRMSDSPKMTCRTMPKRLLLNGTIPHFSAS